MNYKPVIGLEVHVELKTKSKMFCGCSADYFGQKPNSHTCPVCLGLPGALPVPNKKAVEWCIMLGLALNCDTPLFSKFDRKNYFYPDLSKGYQISQYDQPFCVKGYVELSNGKKIGITRVHMEEDTGKLIHDVVENEKVSLVDFNRSGVPLVEIVTDPDFETAEEVKEYLQKLQQIVRYLGISNADMDKGDMRLEPNISLSKDEKGLPSYKVEVKNINSFKFVGKAIEYEIKRQTEILDKDETPVQETRGFMEKDGSTVSQRIKEEASDYRYFPEPDIPPLRWTQEFLDLIRKQLPQLPSKRLEKFTTMYSLPNNSAEILTRSTESSDFFENAVLEGKRLNLTPVQIANYIINRKADTNQISPSDLVIKIAENSKIEEIDEEELNKIIGTVLSENTKAVEDYKNGKENAIMYLVGQVMRQFKQRIESEKIKASLLAKLK